MRNFFTLFTMLLALGVSAAPASAADANTHDCGIRQLPVPEARKGVYNFKDACRAHDLCYTSMKDGVRYERKFCDDRFRKAMQSHCKQRKMSRKNKVLCSTRADIYYFAVRGPLGIWAYRVLEDEVVERDLG